LVDQAFVATLYTCDKAIQEVCVWSSTLNAGRASLLCVSGIFQLVLILILILIIIKFSVLVLVFICTG
jgi:hypothetical protein